MKTLSKAEKDSIIMEGVTAFMNLFPDDKIKKNCLKACVALATVLAKRGINGKVVAGSVSWRVIKPEDDDGKSADCLSYQFSREAAMRHMILGIEGMPEMHVWILLEDMSIVDMTTRYAAEIAREEYGMTLASQILPEYVWSQQCDMDNSFYDYHPSATQLALAMITSLINPSKQLLVSL